MRKSVFAAPRLPPLARASVLAVVDMDSVRAGETGAGPASGCSAVLNCTIAGPVPLEQRRPQAQGSHQQGVIETSAAGTVRNTRLISGSRKSL